MPRKTTSFLDEIVMDVAVMNKSINGYKNVLIMIDQYSKLVRLTPLIRQDEKSVLKVLKNNWIYKFGKPKCIVSDRGAVFTGTSFTNFCNEMNIKQSLSSPFQHQSNGLAERTIRTMRDMIVTSITDGEESTWIEVLPKVEFVMNSTMQSTTGYSPFEIIFGRKICIHGSDVTRHRDQIKEDVDKNAEKSRERMINYDSEKRVNRRFAIGEYALVKKEPANQKKDSMRYEGPYKILEFLSPHQVQLQYPNMKKSRRIEWLKKI